MSKTGDRFEPKKVNKILDEIVAQKQLKKGLTQVKIVEAWNQAMGKNIEKYTQSVSFESGVLYVAVSSAPLKMELTYEKEKIVHLLNNHLENPLITKIVFH